MWMHALSQSWVHEHGAWRPEEGIYLSLCFILLRQSLTEPGARQAVILPLPQTLSAGVTHAWITPSFLGIWTQIFMFVQQPLSPTELPCQPSRYLCLVLFGETGSDYVILASLLSMFGTGPKLRDPSAFLSGGLGHTPSHPTPVGLS